MVCPKCDFILSTSEQYVCNSILTIKYDANKHAEATLERMIYHFAGIQELKTQE